MLIRNIVVALWVGWGLSWIVAARWSARTENHVTGAGPWTYRGLALVGAVLLAVPPAARAGPQLWPMTHALAWLLTGLIGLGFAFTWWARLYLGKLWSSAVTRKTDHHIIATGPYGLVRHPIYTGITLAAFATAVLEDHALPLAGAVLLTLAWYVKARIEERFLRAELGAADYDAYAAKVPMLIPFVRF